jgi:type I restriction enzyme S subunit
MPEVVYRLDEVCSVTMGQAPSGEAYNSTGMGWPLIAGAGDFSNGRARAKKYTTQASKLSIDGDIILGIRASIGAKVWSDGVYCLGRGVAGLRSRPTLDAGYLWHWLTYATPSLAAKGKGATFKQVSRQDIGEMPIALPPLEEQRRIAAILDQADALRAKRREALVHLDDLTQSIFQDMFGDPVTNPRGWPLTTLTRLGQLDRGVSRHRPRNDPLLLGGRHPLVQTGEVANSAGYIRTFTGTYSEIGLAQSKKWPTGTLCITIAANIAKTGILTFDACFPDSVVGFTSDKATTQYVRVWLGFLQATLERAAPQSAQKKINLAILRSLPVPKPPAENIEQFARRVERLEEAKSLATTHADGLDGLFVSLQSRAFAGEL